MGKNLEKSMISQKFLLGLTTSPSSNFESSSLVSFSGLISDFSVGSSDFSDFSVDSSDFSDLFDFSVDSDFSGLDFFSSSSEELSSSSESSKK